MAGLSKGVSAAFKVRNFGGIAREGAFQTVAHSRRTAASKARAKGSPDAGRLEQKAAASTKRADAARKKLYAAQDARMPGGKWLRQPAGSPRGGQFRGKGG